MAAERAQQLKATLVLREAESEHKKKKQQKGFKAHGDLKLDDLYNIVKVMKDADVGVPVRDR